MTDPLGSPGVIALIGGGKIGEALIAGMATAGDYAGRIRVVESNPDRASMLRTGYQISTPDLAGAVAGAAIVIIAIKPADVTALLAELAVVVESHQLVVSVAAGVTIAKLEAGLGAGQPVVRCMPNTPALIGQAITAISAGSHADDTHLDLAERVLASVGRVVRVPETQLDAVTAVSGSGPAYFFLVVEALIEAGVQQGLPRPLATELVVQTAVGSAMLLRDGGEHPVALREAVTSPGGTTAAGVSELERHGLRSALAAAVQAASERSAELGGAATER